MKSLRTVTRTSESQALPLLYKNEPVLKAHEQISDILRARLGGEHASVLASARIEAPGVIEWRTSLAGDITHASDLPADEASKLSSRAERIRKDIVGLAAQMHDEGLAARIVGELLENAMHLPPGSWLYSVGGKPVTIMWGHDAAAKTASENAAGSFDPSAGRQEASPQHAEQRYSGSTAEIFISYREGDSKAWAISLADDLASAFGRERIFLDKDSLHAGNWLEQIHRNLRACKVFIVVIGPRWLGITDGEGKTRLAKDDDVHRDEISQALGRPEVTVIPILVDGAKLPEAKDLPPNLQRLSSQQARKLSDIALHRSQDLLTIVSDIELATGIKATAKGHHGNSRRPKMSRRASWSIVLTMAFLAATAGILEWKGYIRLLPGIPRFAGDLANADTARRFAQLLASNDGRQIYFDIECEQAFDRSDGTFDSNARCGVIEDKNTSASFILAIGKETFQDYWHKPVDKPGDPPIWFVVSIPEGATAHISNGPRGAGYYRVQGTFYVLRTSSGAVDPDAIYYVITAVKP